ncbi:hypothetical protein SLS55_003734 [Diplodia seriata]|uniref:Uncharacterized protein n=1 Tax=Diplodia seriata TaxID=420778 RepID=A0ABR3CNU1_9PEZI
MSHGLQRHVGGRINRSGRFKHHFGHFHKSFLGLKRRIVVVVLLTVRRDGSFDHDLHSAAVMHTGPADAAVLAMVQHLA